MNIIFAKLLVQIGRYYEIYIIIRLFTNNWLQNIEMHVDKKSNIFFFVIQTVYGGSKDNKKKI